MSENRGERPPRVLPPHPLGTYIHFAHFRDATKDVVPMRTRPATGRHPDSGWVETILDEAEWLARPDLWAVGLFPRAKGELAEHHSIRWVTDNLLDCPVCRQIVHLLWTESGFNPAPLDTHEWTTSPRVPNESTSAFAARLGCTCGDDSLLRFCRYFAHGLILQRELFNKLVERLLRFAWRRPGASPEQREQAWDFGRNLALDLCGPNPFRPIAFDPRWRSESAVALARTAYDTRNFTLLPILADALEEAGCDHPEVLTHCRDPNGVHVRGCWVLDGVLGKE